MNKDLRFSQKAWDSHVKANWTSQRLAILAIGYKNKVGIKIENGHVYDVQQGRSPDADLQQWGESWRARVLSWFTCCVKWRWGEGWGFGGGRRIDGVFLRFLGRGELDRRSVRWVSRDKGWSCFGWRVDGLSLGWIVQLLTVEEDYSVGC